MFNHTTVAKAFVISACTLAVALLTIGTCVNSTWAESDQPSGLNFIPITSEVVFQPAPAPSPTRRSITQPRQAQSKKANGQVCNGSDECTSGCCVIPKGNDRLKCGARGPGVSCND